MLMSKATRAEMRHILMGMVFICVACTAVANLYCAVVYEGVFMVRSRGWAYLDTSPARFYFSVIASLVVVPSGAFLGWIGLMGAKDQRVFYEPPPIEPRFEDPAKSSRLKP